MVSPPDWERFLGRYPDAHLLQAVGWGDLKASFGWRVSRLVSQDAGAQVLFRQALPGFSLAYLAKGPVGNPGAGFWEDLDHVCRREGAFLLKVEPDGWLKSDDLNKAPLPVRYQPSSHCIQPPRTLLIDLSGSEEDVLSRMKQKTRYNIHLALKKGVRVRVSNDLEEYHRLAVVTGKRDRFGVHSLAYYRKAYDLFHPRGECELLLAEVQAQVLAGLMVFRHGRHAYYLYGASSDTGRNWMPTYLVQWEAMRWARECGCTDYDLWGVPDATLEELEAQFLNRSDGLWGVYRFKRGFGGRLVRGYGAFDRIYNPAAAAIYRLWLGARRGSA